MEKKMKFKEILAYSLGLFGFQAIVGLLNSYQAEFYGSVMAADLAIAGILILVAKLVSAVFDPIVGNLIDRSKGKSGKFKPFILASIIPLLILTAIIFLEVPFRGTSLYIWIFATYLLWSLAMTLGDVPSQGIAAVLTPNPTERTNVVSIANTAKQIGFSACVVVVPVVCLLIPGGSQVFGYEGEKDTPMISKEYLFTAIGTALLGCILFSLIYFWNKERVPYTSEKMTMGDMWRAFKGNKPLMMVIISYFLGFGRQMAMGIQVQAANVLLGSQNLVAVLGIVTAIGSMISMAITPVLIKKFGERNVFIGMSLYGFVISVVAFLVGTKTWLMYPCLFLIGLQFGAVTLMPMIMTADCVDHYEYETGKRTEGAAYAVLSLTIKVCLALGTALGLVFLRFANYDASVSTFDPSTVKTIYFAYTAMPGIFSLLAIIPMFKYDIVGKKKEEIAIELQKRRETKV